MVNNLIYALLDPRNDMVVYVGKTTVGMSRPMMHLHYSHNENVRKWVDDLSAINLTPKIYVIEEGIELMELSKREQFWINEYYKINPNIFNVALNGNNKKGKMDFNVNWSDVQNALYFLKNMPMFLKGVRLSFKLNQTELGEYLDIARSTIGILENGGDAKLSNIVAIIELYNKLYNGEPVDIKFGKKIRVGRFMKMPPKS